MKTSWRIKANRKKLYLLRHAAYRDADFRAREEYRRTMARALQDSVNASDLLPPGVTFTLLEPESSDNWAAFYEMLAQFDRDISKILLGQ